MYVVHVYTIHMNIYQVSTEFWSHLYMYNVLQNLEITQDHSHNTVKGQIFALVLILL